MVLLALHLFGPGKIDGVIVQQMLTLPEALRQFAASNPLLQIAVNGDLAIDVMLVLSGCVVSFHSPSD